MSDTRGIRDPSEVGTPHRRSTIGAEYHRRRIPILSLSWLILGVGEGAAHEDAASDGDGS